MRIPSVGTGSGNVRFWRLDTGAGQSFEAHSNTVSALATGKNWCGSLILASGGFDGAIVLWMTDAKDGIREDRVSKRRFPHAVTGKAESLFPPRSSVD